MDRLYFMQTAYVILLFLKKEVFFVGDLFNQVS